MMTVAILSFAAVLYALGWLRRRPAEAERVPAWCMLCFFAGELVLAATLLSPLRALSEVSLALHFLQQSLLMVVAAPLLVLARPVAAFAGLLPQRARPSGAAATARRSVVASAVGWLAPAVALAAWHTPAALAAALASATVRGVADATLLLAGMLFWNVLVQGGKGRMSFRSLMIFIGGTAAYLALAGAVLSLAPVILFAGYDHPSLFGMTAMEDQEMAGLILWMPAVSVLAMCAIAMVMASTKTRHAQAARQPAPRDV